MTLATKLSENPKIQADKNKLPSVTRPMYHETLSMWDKKKKEDNGAAFNGPQNSQPLFTGKYDGPIFRTTAETEEFCCLQQ